MVQFKVAIPAANFGRPIELAFKIETARLKLSPKNWGPKAELTTSGVRSNLSLSYFGIEFIASEFDRDESSQLSGNFGVFESSAVFSDGATKPGWASN